MKIGIIQTQRLGDLIIVLPIAQWFADQGHEVVWPIHAAHLAAMTAAAPEITILPVDPALETADPDAFFYTQPLALLNQNGCERVHFLYSHLDGDGRADQHLIGSLKFDEYKYAHARVPFAQKWNLRLTRDKGRELALHKSLGLTGDYILLHGKGSIWGVELSLPPHWKDRYRIVEIAELTDNPFDWIHTIENAAKLVMIDSSFANLTEQLNIAGEKYLVLRNIVQQTPVYRNGWTFCWPFDPIREASP